MVVQTDKKSDETEDWTTYNGEMSRVLHLLNIMIPRSTSERID